MSLTDPATDDAIAARAGAIVRSPLKRAIDVAASFVGLIVLSPIILILMLAIRMEHAGAPIARERRTGLLGAPFHMFLFRPTRMGALLHRLGLENLPALVNVLRGEMSLVGPRSHGLAEDEDYGSVIPRYDARFGVKPGLVQPPGPPGSAPDIAAMTAQLNHDLDYIRRWSPTLDIAILTRRAPPFAPAPSPR